MGDRTIRSLTNLDASAAASRTLNLIAIWKRCGAQPEYGEQPFFQSVALNRSIIVKHRLRGHERDEIYDGRTTATKVILPIDPTDLKMGARSFFVGQKGYEDFLDDMSIPIGGRDDTMLQVLATLPSLDPFLMRERLEKSGFRPDRCYFDLTEADTRRMFNFVRREVAPLIGMSFGAMDARAHEKTAKLARKVLSDASAEELEPLRKGLGMSPEAFVEGVFCWKGFIYYKWTLSDALPKVRPVASEIASVRPNGPCTADDRHYILSTRKRLGAAIFRACDTVRATLKQYDDAYAQLTRNGQPQAFRDFLLQAPDLFYDLGERLGAVNHIISFWRFRCPENHRLSIANEELIDLLADFEASISFDDEPGATMAA